VTAHAATEETIRRPLHRVLRCGPILSFILGTGLRRGEALALRWAQVSPVTECVV
jgi:integrase